MAKYGKDVSIHWNSFASCHILTTVVFWSCAVKESIHPLQSKSTYPQKMFIFWSFFSFQFAATIVNLPDGSSDPDVQSQMDPAHLQHVLCLWEVSTDCCHHEAPLTNTFPQVTCQWSLHRCDPGLRWRKPQVSSDCPGSFIRLFPETVSWQQHWTPHCVPEGESSLCNVIPRC